jgi:tetratricopeptide (TPR) repeat protein
LLTALVHQNRGLCYEYMGRYEEALDAYASAERRYTALGMHERVGEILDNRGAVLLHLGRSSEALEARETAARIFEEADLTLSHAKALVNIGEAHLHLGNYALSLDAFERTRRMLASIDALADRHLLLGDMADAYLELNLHSEALATYREAEKALRAAGMVHDRARVLWGAVSTSAYRRDFEDAEEKLAEAAALFGEAGNVPLLSGVMLEQASLQAALGDRAAALTTAHRALELVSGTTCRCNKSTPACASQTCCFQTRGRPASPDRTGQRLGQQGTDDDARRPNRGPPVERPSTGEDARSDTP